MLKNALCLLFLGLFVAVFSSGAQAVLWTDADPANHLWSNGANWDGGVAVAAGMDAEIWEETVSLTRYTYGPDGGVGPTVDSVVNFAKCKFRNGDIFIVEGGSLISANYIEIGYWQPDSGGVPPFIGSGRMTVSGNGHVEGPYFWIGDSTDGYMTMKDNSTAQTGGYIYVGGPVPVQTGDGFLSMEGGTFTCDNIKVLEGSNIDLLGGTLVIAGDKQDKVAEYAGDGRMTAYGGPGTLDAQYDGVNTIVTAEAPSGLAWNPVPANNATPVESSSTEYLTWNEGPYVGDVNQNDVYFGTSFDDVNDADTSTAGIYKGRQDANSYVLPTSMNLGTYYWRVDEVNEADNDIRKGNVWSFITMRTIDDMESYNMLSAPYITDSWIASNGWIDLEYDLQNVQGGAASMELSYPATVTKTFEVAEDWTVGKVLSLSFLGSENNSDGQISVKLIDSDGDSSPTIVYADANMVDTMKVGYYWHRFLIDMQDFSSGNMDIDSVASIEISLASTGSGTVYIDDIIMLDRGCFVEQVSDCDFTKDCVIDEIDLFVLAESWLEQGKTVVAAQPDSNRLMVQYSFEDSTTDGYTDDSSGNDYHGRTYGEGGPSYANIMKSGGYDGSNCVSLRDDYYEESYEIQCPNSIFASVSSEVTISVWIKLYDYVAPGIVDAGQLALIKINGVWGGGIYTPDNSKTTLEFAFGGSDYAGWGEVLPSDWKGTWNHYAFVKDANVGSMGIYRNGELVYVRNQRTVTMEGVSLFEIGNLKFKGLLDEFRVYDYALSQEEILTLAGKSSIYQPVIGIDPVVDNSVDFKDFAALAEAWSDEVFWP